MRIYFLILLVVLANACAPNRSEHNEDINRSQLHGLDTASIAMSADLYYKTNRYDNALREYTSLLEVDSMRGLFLYRKAFCLAQLDQTHEAIQYYERTLQMKYREFDCYYSIGVLYAGTVENDSLAILYHEKSLAIRPESEQAISLLKSLKDASSEIRL